MQTIQTQTPERPPALGPPIEPPDLSASGSADAIRGRYPPAPPPRASNGVGAPGTAPAPAQPRSVLGGLVLSLALLALGVLVLVDVAGAAVPASAYVAVPLAVIGAGLVLGAWYGRARGLIWLGVALSVALAITIPAEAWNLAGSARSVAWRPAGIEQLDRTYEIGAGNGVLDLSAVDFTDRSESVDVHVSVGNLDIVLPPNVDVDIRANVEVGNATVLGHRWGGINQSAQTISDDGPDGPGGGHLSIRATVDVGDLEVRR